MVETLSLRKTHKFVGQWQHEDDWQDIGEVKLVMGQTVHTDEEDPCDPTTAEGFAEVQTYQPELPSKIRLALHDTYTHWGCDHEYDCCGCVSYHANVDHIAGPMYRVTITSSRNY
jgi:hypothetical protein